MAAGEVRVGDIGTLFQATITDGSTAVDVSLFTSSVFWFKPPRSTSFMKPAAFTNSGSDGLVEYTSTGADVLNEPGSWKLQWRGISPTANLRSDIYEFTVHKNL